MQFKWISSLLPDNNPGIICSSPLRGKSTDGRICWSVGELNMKFDTHSPERSFQRVFLRSISHKLLRFQCIFEMQSEIIHVLIHLAFDFSEKRIYYALWKCGYHCSYENARMLSSSRFSAIGIDIFAIAWTLQPGYRYKKRRWSNFVIERFSFVFVLLLLRYSWILSFFTAKLLEKTRKTEISLRFRR